MRDIREVGAIPGLEEECHTSNQTDESVLIPRVGDSDCDEEDACDDSEEDLRRVLGFVNEICFDAMSGNLPARASWPIRYLSSGRGSQR